MKPHLYINSQRFLSGAVYGFVLALFFCLLSGCSIKWGDMSSSFMQVQGRETKIETMQNTTIGFSFDYTQSSSIPSVRLGYNRTQITSIPAYIPERQKEPAVSISTITDLDKKSIEETFNIGK